MIGAPGDDVRVVYTKYDGSLHWHQTMSRLGEDDHGVWLGARAGVIAQKGNEPSIILHHAHVMLFRPGVWWTAAFNSRQRGVRVELYCDITTPVVWSHSREVTMVDLDLDVVRDWKGRVSVLDEDEFAEHSQRYGYPVDVIEKARGATDALASAVAEGSEPFATHYRSWLEMVS